MLRNKFKLKSEYKPAGDQPEAIASLVDGIKKNRKKQTLLGVTGSGKTFTIANVIEKIQKPTLVIAHNKTLAAQLAGEFKQLFPDNAVHYFVSYYDYYQPEAYIAVSDTYIEKDASINKEIDRLRHASTQSLLTRNDVIIVASVSCIYGLGSPEEYREENMLIEKGMKISRSELLKKLIHIFYERTNADLSSGKFRAIGNRIEVMPVSETIMYSLTFEGNTISSISKIDPVSSKILDTPDNFFLFPAKHFLTQKEKKERAVKLIKKELTHSLKKFEKEGKLLEAERLKRRTNYDIAMIRELGYTSGIENYSRHLSGKKEGDPPETLLSYFSHKKDGSPDFLTVIDESHVTLPQIRGMFAGDRARKNNLVEHGFRLPSAKDNRPLMYEEFEQRIGDVIYTTATPSDEEKEKSEAIVEQVIRPTGLVDPKLDVRPVTASSSYKGQVQDFIIEAKKEIKKKSRAIATTLTKKMAEDLTEYLKEEGIKTEYIHSDVKTIDRIKILTEFRKGTFDVLVGVNLLREGLDLPEVTFIGILDADKEGFLRSETALIQTIGRAARNVNGRVILYADRVTGSMERAMDETNRRRALQVAHNKKHKITPQTIIKKIHDITEEMDSMHEKAVQDNLSIDMKLFERSPKKFIKRKEKEMNTAVKDLDFETAAIIRDEIAILKNKAENK
ncbi:excinuclease ABC subunit B [Candidatus Wolfebacteria bacterium]|nr:MAG: excinuclease ABC subunit B [Candidatus Wolfebacteria bacterium]